MGMTPTERKIIGAAMAYYWSIGRKSGNERFRLGGELLDACAKLDDAQKAGAYGVWPPRPEGTNPEREP